MQEKCNVEKINYEHIGETDIKKLSDKVLIDKVQNTYKFLKLCEIYLKDVKDDYGKKKIAGLRVDFLRHQVDLLMRECSARGIKHGLSSYYSIG
ncbi:MAG TPA: hypothetical protein VIK78_12885 [Ruminiclostridium sp.]